MKKSKKKLYGDGGYVVNDPSLAAMSLVLMNRNKDKNFVQRALDPSQSIDNEDGTSSTHGMARSSVDNGTIIYPTIIQAPDGSLQQLSKDEAADYAVKNRQAIFSPGAALGKYIADGGYKIAANKLARENNFQLGNGGTIDNFIDPITIQGLSTPRIAYPHGGVHNDASGEVSPSGTLYTTDKNLVQQYNDSLDIYNTGKMYEDWYFDTVGKLRDKERKTPLTRTVFDQVIQETKKKHGFDDKMDKYSAAAKREEARTGVHPSDVSTPGSINYFTVDGKDDALGYTTDPTYKPKQRVKYAPPEIVEKQKKLRDAGLYDGILDGIWGKNSQTAWEKYTNPKEKPEENIIYTDDPNDPRLKEYQNKLDVYNKYKKLLKNLTPMTQEWADDNSAALFEDSFVLTGDSKDDEKNKKAFDEFKRKEKELNDYAKSVGVDMSPDTYTDKNTAIYYNRNVTDGEGLDLVSMYDKPTTTVIYKEKEKEEEIDIQEEVDKELKKEIKEEVKKEEAVPKEPYIKKITSNFGPASYWYVDTAGNETAIKSYNLQEDRFKDLKVEELDYYRWKDKAQGGFIKDTDMQNMDFNRYVALMNAQRQQMKKGGIMDGWVGDVTATTFGILDGGTALLGPLGKPLSQGLDTLHSTLDHDIDDQEKALGGWGKTAGAVASTIINPAALPQAISKTAEGVGEGIAYGTSYGKRNDGMRQEKILGASNLIGNVGSFAAGNVNMGGQGGMGIEDMAQSFGGAESGIMTSAQQAGSTDVSGMGEMFNATGQGTQIDLPTNPAWVAYGGMLQMAQGGFKPHPMYKGNEMVMANDYATHLRLKEQGYGHQQNTQNMEQGGLMSIETGGTHEQNPMGGVPVGPKASVEQGETIMDLIEGGKFVFTDRDGPKGKKGKTFADISKQIKKKYKDREGDAAAKRAMDQELYALANQQEEQKEAKMAKLQAQMDELNPQGAAPQMGMVVDDIKTGNTRIVPPTANPGIPQQPQQDAPLPTPMKAGGIYYNNGGFLNKFDQALYNFTHRNKRPPLPQPLPQASTGATAVQMANSAAGLGQNIMTSPQQTGAPITSGVPSPGPVFSAPNKYGLDGTVGINPMMPMEDGGRIPYSHGGNYHFQDGTGLSEELVNILRESNPEALEGLNTSGNLAGLMPAINTDSLNLNQTFAPTVDKIRQEAQDNFNPDITGDFSQFKLNPGSRSFGSLPSYESFAASAAPQGTGRYSTLLTPEQIAELDSMGYDPTQSRAFQEYVQKNYPNALPKYGVDDVTGKETMDFIKANPNAWKEFQASLNPQKKSATSADGTVAGDGNVGTGYETFKPGNRTTKREKTPEEIAAEKAELLKQQRQRNLMIGLGATANSAGDFYNLIHGMRGPEDIELARLNPNYVNLDEQRQIARENAGVSQANLRDNLRNTAQSSSGNLAGTVAGTAAIDQNLGNILRQSAVDEETMNTQIANTANQFNTGIGNKEIELNMLAEAKAQEAIAAGLHGIGRNTAGALKDVRMSNQVDNLNDIQLDAINNILSNYEYDRNNKLRYKTPGTIG